MTLANLTPEDWTALAGVPEGACTLEGWPADQRARLAEAGVIRSWGTITDRGLGVIAAARVLVKSEQEAAAEVERLSAMFRPAPFDLQIITRRVEGSEQHAGEIPPAVWAAVEARARRWGITMRPEPEGRPYLDTLTNPADGLAPEYEYVGGREVEPDWRKDRRGY